METLWQVEDNHLVRAFTFTDFHQAMDFINKVADIANSLDHHPEMRNIYNKVWLRLTTHDAGNTITEKDRTFAAKTDALLA